MGLLWGLKYRCVAAYESGFSIANNCLGKAENFSAQETVNSLLSTTNALSDLEGLMNMIFARKAENIPPIP